MKKLRLIWILLLTLLPFGAAAQDLDMHSYIFGHIGDSYEWHITTVNGKPVSIPLPVMVYSKTLGFKCFNFSKIEEGEEYEGFRLAAAGEPNEGKVVEAATGERPMFDISITKNVLSLMFSAILLCVLILTCSRWYRKHDVLKEKPTGLAALLEPVIVMLTDDVIKDAIGPQYRKFTPYLLTAFFFILISNLLGIIPFFPGGANVTGNIAITLVLAMFTFFMVNIFGNKHYFKEIFWPDVPLPLKAIPIMPLIEVVGMFTKPFSLMVRLFANILAGHIMILSTLALIFLTAKMGAVINGSLTVVSALFGVFLDFLELLVAFIQAYVFTMLSAVFIGQAHPEPEKETN